MQPPDRAHPAPPARFALNAPVPRSQTGQRPFPSGAAPKDFSISIALQVGKYLVSASTHPLDGGRHSAAVSIRSGHGSMTHDRVMRFVPVFDSPELASRFAVEQALAWIDERHPSTPPLPLGSLSRKPFTRAGHVARRNSIDS